MQMSKLDDLHTLVRLLNELELPVSPILEYAIKEKEEELLNISQEESTLMPSKEPMKKVTFKVTDEVTNQAIVTTKKISVLRVYRDDGTFIEEEKSTTTMCKTIKEVGVKSVYDMKIPMDGMHLVTKGINPQYPSSQHDIGNGLFVNTHSNTITKKRQLERIFKTLKINWRVEIVEL